MSEKELDKAISRLMRRFGADAVRRKIEDAAKTHAPTPKKTKGRGAPAFAVPRDMLVLSLATLVRLGAGGTWRSAANWLFRNVEVRALSSVTDDIPYWRGLRSNHWGGETPETRFRASAETVRRIITRALATLRAAPELEKTFAIAMSGVLFVALAPAKPWGLAGAGAFPPGTNLNWSCSASHADVVRRGARQLLNSLDPDAAARFRQMVEGPAVCVVGK